MCIRSEKLRNFNSFQSRNNIEIEDKIGLNSFALCFKPEKNKVMDGLQSFANVNTVRKYDFTKSKKRWLFLSTLK